MQIQTTMKYHFTLSKWPSSKSLQTLDAGKCVEKKEHSYTVGRNINWCSHYGEQYGDSLKNYITILLYNAVIPSLVLYLEKTIIWKNTYISMFIAALVNSSQDTEATLLMGYWWVHLYPLTGKRIKMWYIYVCIYIYTHTYICCCLVAK